MEYVTYDTMKVHLTPEAKGHLNLYRRLDDIGTGFLIGNEIGKHIMVKSFIPLKIDHTNIDRIYHAVYNEYGRKLIGVFFKESHFFLSDWFMGDVILKFDQENMNFYHFDIQNNMTAYKLWEAK